MGFLGDKVTIKLDQLFMAFTNIGNVSQEMLGFHNAFAIPMEPNAALQGIKFIAIASMDKAHMAAIKSARCAAIMTFRVLVDNKLTEGEWALCELV